MNGEVFAEKVEIPKRNNSRRNNYGFKGDNCKTNDEIIESPN
jgi:hypothetical protein